MSLNDLKSILYSNRGYTQQAIIYDSQENKDIECGNIDYIVKKYGEKKVIRIEAFENNLIITV